MEPFSLLQIPDFKGFFNSQMMTEMFVHFGLILPEKNQFQSKKAEP
jgi:hypothetical protein